MEAALASILAASAPLIFATIGETITEKSGVINLSLDGSILLSAMAAFAVALTTGSVWLGFLAAMIVSMLVALLVAYASISLKLNQVAVGFVLTLLCTDLSSFLGNPFVNRQGVPVPHMPIPILKDIPLIGPIIFDQDLTVYASLLTVFVAYLFMFKTRRGLELQGVGERPEAAYARGIPVNRMRYLYAAIGGLLVGAGGAAYSLDVKLGWSYRHTAGLGWIALAIVIFGGWHPFRVAFGAYLFGALQTLALKLQPVMPNLSQVLSTLPFPLMIFTLLLVSSDSVARLLDRFPALRGILRSDPPSAL
ncbi:MAG TPA: ABC transporter permease, partial [Anaerolineae bacterium]